MQQTGSRQIPVFTMSCNTPIQQKISSSRRSSLLDPLAELLLCPEYPLNARLLPWLRIGVKTLANTIAELRAF